MDWEIILMAISIIGGAVIAFFRIRTEWRKIAPTSRFALKRDLEILGLIKSSLPKDPKYKIVKKAIDDKIDEIYSPVQQIGFKRVREYNWGILIFGFILLIVFSLWTWYLVKDGFTWWALLTGFFAFAGIGNIINGLEKKQKKPEKSSDTSKNKTNQGGATTKVGLA